MGHWRTRAINLFAFLVTNTSYVIGSLRSFTQPCSRRLATRGRAVVDLAWGHLVSACDRQSTSTLPAPCVGCGVVSSVSMATQQLWSRGVLRPMRSSVVAHTA